MVRAIRCHRRSMKTNTINGSEVSRLSVAIQFFESIEVSEKAVEAARKSRAEYQNLELAKKGKPRLSLEKMISQAWNAFRNRFKAYRLMRKAHGEKRARARRETKLSYREISARVRKELTQELAAGKLCINFQDIGTEIKMRVKERMIMSRILREPISNSM